MKPGLMKVTVGGVTIYTTLEDVARCLEELDSVLANGTAEEADIDCVFKALNYLKKYKSRDPRILGVVRTAESILKSDIESERVKLW